MVPMPAVSIQQGCDSLIQEGLGGEGEREQLMHAARSFRLLSGAAASLIQVSQSCFSYGVDDFFFTDSGWDRAEHRQELDDRFQDSFARCRRQSEHLSG